MLRTVVGAVSLIGAVQRLGVRVPNRLLHGVAAWHKRVRQLLWPFLIRKTPFTRVVEIAEHSGALAGLTAVVPVTERRTVSVPPGRHRVFVDRTYDYDRGRLSVKGGFVAVFRDAYVHTSSGLVCTAAGQVLADSAKGIERHIDGAIGVDLTTKPRLAGAYTTIMCKSYANYYHWFHDCLLRLYLLHEFRDRPPLAVMAPPALRAYQQQSLRYCLPSATRVEPVADDWIQVEQLVLPSFITDPLVGMAPPEAWDFVRRRVLAQVCPGDPPGPRRRLYLSRASAGHRQIRNEPEILADLRAYGFEIVQPERLAFDEQIRLFRSAEIIVGARGAALTNMLFADRARILEITSDRPFAGAIYFNLARALGHDHHHVFCRPDGASYVVDPEAFRTALDTALAPV